MSNPSRQSPTRVIGWMIALVGSAAILAALGLRGPAAFTHLSSHFAELHFGMPRWLGCAYGAGVLAVGLALSFGAFSQDGTAGRQRAALMLTAGSAAFSVTLLVWPQLDAQWVLLGYVAALCVLLP